MKKFIPKIIFTDIDGVWTDGGMYYDNNQNELKKFNTNDSLGVLLCKIFKIECVILTGEKSQIVSNRANKLSIESCFQNVKNKLQFAKEFCESKSILINECAFIGDGLNDLKLLKEVGYSGAPVNAINIIKNQVDYITKTKGGEGAFLDFTEHLLLDEKNTEHYYNKIINEFYK